jgi:hypothetical protein
MPTPREEIAWAAGLFEGEGCMTITGGQPVMRVASTDRDSTDRFYEIMGVGKVYGPYHQGPPRKPNWVWVAYGVDTLLAIQLLVPWLGERHRARARELFGNKYVPEGTRFHGKTRP